MLYVRGQVNTYPISPQQITLDVSILVGMDIKLHKKCIGTVHQAWIDRNRQFCIFARIEAYDCINGSEFRLCNNYDDKTVCIHMIERIDRKRAINIIPFIKLLDPGIYQ